MPEPSHHLAQSVQQRLLNKARERKAPTLFSSAMHSNGSYTVWDAHGIRTGLS